MPKAHFRHSALTDQSLGELLRHHGFSLDAPQVSRLAQYLALLAKWNQVMNLVGPGNWVDIVETLILDSLYLARYLPRAGLPEAPLCWDFGSGAGIPGIPLRIVWPEGSYYMVEAREKRALFMRTVLAQVDLPGTQVSLSRIEDFMDKNTPADILISRAFMPWDKLLAHMQGHLAKGGKILIMALDPAPALPVSLAEHWRLVDEYSYLLPGQNKERYFWLFSSF